MGSGRYNRNNIRLIYPEYSAITKTGYLDQGSMQQLEVYDLRHAYIRLHVLSKNFALHFTITPEKRIDCIADFVRTIWGTMILPYRLNLLGDGQQANYSRPQASILLVNVV